MSDLVRAAGAPPYSGKDGVGEGAGSRGPGDRKAGAHLNKPGEREAGAHLDKPTPQGTAHTHQPTKLALDQPARLSDEAVLAEIQRVAALVTGRFYRCSLLEANSPVRYRLLHRRFGGWRAALAKAGVPHLYRPKRPSAWRAKRPNWRLGEADLLDELRRIARAKGSDTISDHDIRRFGRHSPSLYGIHFGSWRVAAARAGLQPTRLWAPRTEAACIDNLRRVWLHCRRPPRAHEMAHPPSTIGAFVYRRRWGGWTAALQAFVALVNATPDDPLLAAVRDWTGHIAAMGRAQLARAPMRGEARRSVPPPLRLTILQRDHFRCALCGASPASDPDCTLEIDHIRPFSRGGRTVAANLRTLCHACNAGRGPHAFTATRARPEEEG